KTNAVPVYFGRVAIPVINSIGSTKLVAPKLDSRQNIRTWGMVSVRRRPGNQPFPFPRALRPAQFAGRRDSRRRRATHRLANPIGRPRTCLNCAQHRIRVEMPVKMSLWALDPLGKDWCRNASETSVKCRSAVAERRAAAIWQHPVAQTLADMVELP